MPKSLSLKWEIFCFKLCNRWFLLDARTVCYTLTFLFKVLNRFEGIKKSIQFSKERIDARHLINDVPNYLDSIRLRLQQLAERHPANVIVVINSLVTQHELNLPVSIGNTRDVTRNYHRVTRKGNKRNNETKISSIDLCSRSSTSLRLWKSPHFLYTYLIILVINIEHVLRNNGGIICAFSL